MYAIVLKPIHVQSVHTTQLCGHTPVVTIFYNLQSNDHEEEVFADVDRQLPIFRVILF